MKEGVSYPRQFLDYRIAYLRALNEHHVKRFGLLPGWTAHPKQGQVFLDLLCGPGGWVFDVARAYPGVQVVGIDSDRDMISAAQLFSYAEGKNNGPLKNAHFSALDLRLPLDAQREQLPREIADGGLDYIRGRHLSSILRLTDWAPRLSEWKRLLRTNGVLALHETGRVETTSSALQEYASLLSHVAHIQGRRFPLYRQAEGTLPALKELLDEAKYQRVQEQSALVNFSAGAGAHAAIAQDILASMVFQQPELVNVGGITPEVFLQLYRHAIEDIQREDFSGSMTFLTILATA